MLTGGGRLNGGLAVSLPVGDEAATLWIVGACRVQVLAGSIAVLGASLRAGDLPVDVVSPPFESAIPLSSVSRGVLRGDGQLAAAFGWSEPASACVVHLGPIPELQGYLDDYLCGPPDFALEPWSAAVRGAYVLARPPPDASISPPAARFLASMDHGIVGVDLAGGDDTTAAPDASVRSRGVGGLRRGGGSGGGARLVGGTCRTVNRVVQIASAWSDAASAVVRAATVTPISSTRNGSAGYAAPAYYSYAAASASASSTTHFQSMGLGGVAAGSVRVPTMPPGVSLLPQVVVTGGKGAGKSTLGRYLCNRLLTARLPAGPAPATHGANLIDMDEEEEEVFEGTAPSLTAELAASPPLLFPSGVAWLDIDLGQPEHTVAGVLSLSLVTSPLLTPPHARTHWSSRVRGTAVVAAGATGRQTPPLPVGTVLAPPSAVCAMRYLGSTSPKADPAAFIAAALELLAEYRLHLAPLGIPLLVNTHGWVRGVGLHTNQAVVAAVAPTHHLHLSGPAEQPQQQGRGRRQGSLPDGDGGGGSQVPSFAQFPFSLLTAVVAYQPLIVAPTSEPNSRPLPHNPTHPPVLAAPVVCLLPCWHDGQSAPPPPPPPQCSQAQLQPRTRMSSPPETVAVTNGVVARSPVSLAPASTSAASQRGVGNQRMQQLPQLSSSLADAPITPSLLRPHPFGIAATLAAAAHASNSKGVGVSADEGGRLVPATAIVDSEHHTTSPPNDDVDKSVLVEEEEEEDGGGDTSNDDDTASSVRAAVEDAGRPSASYESAGNSSSDHSGDEGERGVDLVDFTAASIPTPTLPPAAATAIDADDDGEAASSRSDSGSDTGSEDGGAFAASAGTAAPPPPRAARSPGDLRSMRLMAYLLCGLVPNAPSACTHLLEDARRGAWCVLRPTRGADGGVKADHSKAAAAAMPGSPHASPLNAAAAAEHGMSTTHRDADDDGGATPSHTGAAGSLDRSASPLVLSAHSLIGEDAHPSRRVGRGGGTSNTIIPSSGYAACAACAALPLTHLLTSVHAAVTSAFWRVQSERREARAPVGGAASPAFALSHSLQYRVPASDVAVFMDPSAVYSISSGGGGGCGGRSSGDGGGGTHGGAAAAAGCGSTSSSSSVSAVGAALASRGVTHALEGLRGQIVGLCSTKRVRAAPLPPSNSGAALPPPPLVIPVSSLPCLGVAYVTDVDTTTHTLTLSTPTPLSILACVDVLVCWAGGNDVPPQLMFRAAPGGDSFAVAASSVAPTVVAVAKSDTNRKNVKRRRLG